MDWFLYDRHLRHERVLSKKTESLEHSKSDKNYKVDMVSKVTVMMASKMIVMMVTSDVFGVVIFILLLLVYDHSIMLPTVAKLPFEH